MLIDQIKTDRIEAMKSKNMNKKYLLDTLIGDASKDAKIPDDAKVVATIKKFISNAEECLKFKEDSKLSEEITILSGYLPHQLTDSELNAIIHSDHFTDMKSGMAYFKANYANQYDGKVVQTRLLARFNIVPTRTV